MVSTCRPVMVGDSTSEFEGEEEDFGMATRLREGWGAAEDQDLETPDTM